LAPKRSKLDAGGSDQSNQSMTAGNWIILNHWRWLSYVHFIVDDLMTWNCTCLLNFLISVFEERLLSQNCARLAERRMHLPRVYNCGTKQEVIFILFCLLGHGVFEKCGKEKKQCENIWKRRILFPRSLWWLSLSLSLSLSVPAALQEVLRSTAITCNQITATGNRWPWGAIGFIEDGIVDVAASLPELPRAWWLPHFLECGNWQLFRNDPKIHWSWISLMNPAEFASARQPNASWGVTLRVLWETRGIWYRMYPAVTSWCETSSSRVYTWSCYPAGHHARTSTTKLK